MHFFKEKFPERFVEIGVAEQNLASVASGMAAMGKIPFITSYAMFSPGRNWEQIRTTIAYNDRPVKIAGSHAGVSVGPDGGTHQAIEDLAITRVMPRMVVISPCDAIEAKKLHNCRGQNKYPSLCAFSSRKTPVLLPKRHHLKLAKLRCFSNQIAGKPDVAIIATGALLHKALKVAQDLEKEKIGMTVLIFRRLNHSMRKPLLKWLKKLELLSPSKSIKRLGEWAALWLNYLHNTCLFR
jgi:transketolase